MNLEYLLLALKVRKTASREPLFSLDPVDPQDTFLLEVLFLLKGIFFILCIDSMFYMYSSRFYTIIQHSYMT